MKQIFHALAIVALIAQSLNATERPNIVVIMADDLGFSDIGCYGSEIETPNLDALAADGLRFSQFYNTAKCHSSRVSLLTGQYCIAAGDTALTHAVTSAEVLRGGGYFTAMTGKWHLKREPTDFGFDRYFGHLSGACNYFSGDKTFRLNGQPWEVPKDNFYTTVADVEYALRFLQEARQAKKPWYLYVAFNAPHAPLHALPEDYAKYKGRYQQGWDKVRNARLAKQKQLGLLSEGVKPSPRPEHIPAWSTLTEWQRRYEGNRMTTLAAMIDRIDQEVGRLVTDLRANNELDNTMILFVSDNGACPYDRRQPRLDVEPTNAETSLGDSTGWAWARNSPFRYYKQNQFEGGISTPAIVHWPAGLKTTSGSIISQPAHLIDVMPTLADITGTEIPDQWDDRELRPVSGVSLKPIFDGLKPGSRPPIHLLFGQDRGLRDGDWKLVSFRSEAWELYNVANDRTELNDLSASEPERLKSMIQTWSDITNNVLHAPAKFNIPVKSETGLPHRNPEWTNFDAETPSDYVRRKRSAAKQTSKNTIRARKNTELKTVGNELQLRFTGDDPGIAMDLRNRKIAAGPYQLTFRLIGGSQGGGELFYTTKPSTTLPKGERTTFDVLANGQWQDVSIELPTDESLQQLRLDVSDGAGKATIADLKLLDASGAVLVAWPGK
jgi:arylsulfatase A-like enzyme